MPKFNAEFDLVIEAATLEEADDFAEELAKHVEGRAVSSVYPVLRVDRCSVGVVIHQRHEEREVLFEPALAVA